LVSFPKWARFLLFTASIAIVAASGQASPLPHPAPVESYAIDTDGGIVYNPLGREAAKTGQIEAYRNVPRADYQLSLGACRVDLQVPERASAYDVVPIPYTLTWKQGSQFPVGVEATAFEDARRRKEKDLYDPSLPHHIDIDAAYLGSVTANVVPGEKQNITADFSDTPKTYPGFTCEPMIRSGSVEEGDLVWFKFHLTNIGDTILSSEGFGGSLLYPELLRKDDNGNYQHYAFSYNMYYRNLKDWYPGESWDPWIIFRVQAKGQPYEYYHLPEGEYKIRLRLTSRLYRSSAPYVDVWDGPVVYTYDQPITVKADALQTPVADGQKQPSPADYPDKLPTFIHTFEQFMTSFDLYLHEPTSPGHCIQGTLNLQVAPWTHNVVLKLIGGDAAGIQTTVVPIAVDDGGARIAIRKGSHNPAFASQLMSDMRTNVQMGPYPEQSIADDLQHMKDLGVNVLATTAMPWFFMDMNKPSFSFAGDAGKYGLDVARKKGFQVNAWGLYPPDRAPSLAQLASWVTGKNYDAIQSIISGYGAGARSVNPVDNLFGEAYSAIVLYNFHRWGDLFYQASNGDVPVDVEDTRGWMRNDVNVHYPVGAPGVAAFRTWVKDNYHTIGAVNAAWGTNFASFDAIDPETHKADWNGLQWIYQDPSHPFHEWNQAMADFDDWRTQTRVTFYRDVLAHVRREIPGAKIELRTEGGNVLVAGLDPESPNAHIRHAYYSQRRCAIVAEPIVASGTVGYHSDYTTMPYTPSELRYLVRISVKQGIIPTYLPAFSDMRDIAINDRYGNEYQTNYNLPAPQKGYLMHVLTASYPWYKIMVEEGGIPGVEWEDYQCDAYVTQTQEKEMQFFQQEINQSSKASSNPKGQVEPSQAWRQRSRALRSYILPVK